MILDSSQRTPKDSVLAYDVIPREYAVKLADARHEKKFRIETLRHQRRTIRGMGLIHRAMRHAGPEGVVLLARQFERLLKDLGPCTCEVTTRMGMVCGEDDCPVHGFGN